MEINYVGEHLIWGYLGRFSVILVFCSALLSAISYWLAERDKKQADSWKKIARTAYHFHAFGIISIITVLFVMLFNHYFEFKYVWEHSNKAMPMQYILSCFWEGQEGSFLLWSFWTMVLGYILIYSAHEWEFSTMTIVALVQVFLSSMLLGVFIGDVRVGSDPFMLLREYPDFMNLPFISQANYLEHLDGRGLNPLLQNYWMTIHPPVLFLGFASGLFPFAYAMAGIWRKKYDEWIQPALAWVFFSVCLLGTGILMGGAWAYEALSFGGFWAWDPVENSSLVPWIALVAGGHVMLLTKARKHSPVTSLVLITLSFVLILYSTFLTRSGILGETSVHAFTDLGMSGQLLLYLLVFLWLPAMIVFSDGVKGWFYFAGSIVLILAGLTGGSFKLLTASFIILSLFFAFRQIGKHYKQEEDKLSSREFWMFIGSLVLMISAFQIIFSTSTPVVNKMISGGIANFFAWLNGIFPSEIFQKLAKAQLAQQEEPIKHFNSWQIPFAIMVGVLMSIAHFLNYRSTPFLVFIRKIARSFLATLIVTILTAVLLELTQPLLITLLFTSVFTVLANLDYAIRTSKAGLKKAGPSIAHIGFGLLLTGALVSSGKKEFISRNLSQYDLGEELPGEENILLFKNDTIRMGEYLVTYRGDSTAGINIYYNVDYIEPSANGSHKKLFTLSPLIQKNERMGNVAEPDTRHYLSKDIFTHVTSVSQPEKEEWEEPVLHQMKVGDTIMVNDYKIHLVGLLNDSTQKAKDPLKDKISVAAKLYITHHGHTDTVYPKFIINRMQIEQHDTLLEHAGMEIGFDKIDPLNELFHIKTKFRKKGLNDFIVMKAIVFPGINILWIGCILMALGTAMAAAQRVRFRNKKNESTGGNIIGGDR